MTQASVQPARLANGAARSPGGRIAGLHRQGGSWRLIIADVEGQRLTVIAAKTIDNDLKAGLQAIAATDAKLLDVQAVIRVASSQSTICRISGAPEGPDSDTVAALSLMAEATLPATLPPHRRGAGLIPDVPRPTGRAAILIGLHGEIAEPLDLLPDVSETWTSEAAALAMLRAGPGEAIYADSQTGAISIMTTGPERTAARVLRGDTSSTDAWEESIRRVINETRQSVAIDGAEPWPLLVGESGHASLMMDGAWRARVADRVAGAPADARWYSQYGLALGAAMLCAAGPATRPLAEMLAAAPVVREPVALQVIDWLAPPRRSAIVLAASVGLLVLAPLGFAAARSAVLASKSAALSAQQSSRDETAKRAALYSQLEQSRWPMTKLMGDLAVATPVGVVIENFRLSTDTGLSLGGKAKDQELINALQANLNNTKIFRNVSVPRVETTSDGSVTFDLSAQIANPHAVPPAGEDFAAKPLAVRLYGEGASNENVAAPAAKGGGRRSNVFASGSRASEKEEGRKPSDPGAAPAALTDEQIAKMDKSMAMKEFSSRRAFVQKNPSIDAAVKQRLNDEVDKLKAQMTKAAPAPAAGQGKGDGK